MMRPPDEIRTDRLILRRWHPDHTVQLKAAIDKNLRPTVLGGLGLHQAKGPNAPAGSASAT